MELKKKGWLAIVKMKTDCEKKKSERCIFLTGLHQILKNRVLNKDENKLIGIILTILKLRSTLKTLDLVNRFA